MSLNFTSPDFDVSLCTVETCPLSLSHLDYLPIVGWNAAYATIFGIALVGQVILGIRFKTWGYLVGAFGGLVLELIGYIGRIMMHDDPFSEGSFIMSLCTLTIAPAFLSASIYLCLSRVIVVVGESISFFKPRTYTITFILFDFVSLILQAAGGAMASIGNTPADSQRGVDIMIGGLVFQVISLTLFLAMCSLFAWNASQKRHQMDPRFVALRSSVLFKTFIVGLLSATIAIFIRSIFRVAELWGGFGGSLANDEVAFMVLEGIMIIIAAVALTVCHPGIVFRDAWNLAGWSFRTSKNANQTKSINESESGEPLETLQNGRTAHQY